MKKLLIKMENESFRDLYAKKNDIMLQNKLMHLIVDAIAVGEKEIFMNTTERKAR